MTSEVLADAPILGRLERDLAAILRIELTAPTHGTPAVARRWPRMAIVGVGGAMLTVGLSVPIFQLALHDQPGRSGAPLTPVSDLVRSSDMAPPAKAAALVDRKGRMFRQAHKSTTTRVAPSDSGGARIVRPESVIPGPRATTSAAMSVSPGRTKDQTEPQSPVLEQSVRARAPVDVSPAALATAPANAIATPDGDQTTTVRAEADANPMPQTSSEMPQVPSVAAARTVRSSRATTGIDAIRQLRRQ